MSFLTSLSKLRKPRIDFFALPNPLSPERLPLLPERVVARRCSFPTRRRSPLLLGFTKS
jgi:hypothetical protein